MTTEKVQPASDFIPEHSFHLLNISVSRQKSWTSSQLLWVLNPAAESKVCVCVRMHVCVCVCVCENLW